MKTRFKTFGNSQSGMRFGKGRGADPARHSFQSADNHDFQDDESPEEDSDEETLEERNSYRSADLDNMYYFI